MSDISVNFVFQFGRDYLLCMRHISVLIYVIISTLRTLCLQIYWWGWFKINEINGWQIYMPILCRWLFQKRSIVVNRMFFQIARWPVCWSSYRRVWQLEFPRWKKILVFRDPGPTNQHTPVDDSLGSPGCMVLELIILGEGVFASTSGLARLQSKYCVPLRLLYLLPPA